MTDALPLVAASELQEMFARRACSPVEVLEAVLARAAVVDPALNALVSPTPELAMAQAREAERVYASRDADIPPLLGLPMTVKDTIAAAAAPTTYGSLLWRDAVPAVDAPVVARALAAGAVLLGKTNTSEFGWKAETTNRVFGTTRNPWAPSLTPGGSSGGCAACVASGIGQLGIGSDAAGSIRIPAAFTGIFGYKPTFGLIPTSNGAFESLAHVGVATRSVRDAALLLESLAGPHVRDRLSHGSPMPVGGLVPRCVRGLKVGWTADLGFAQVDEEVGALARDAAFALRTAGAQVEEVRLTAVDPHDICYTLLAAGHAAMHRDAASWAEQRDLVDPGRVAMIEDGLAMSAADVGAAMNDRAAWVEDFLAQTRDYDILLSPTVPITAFEAGLDHPGQVLGGEPTSALRWTPFTYGMNLTGQPAASVPCGMSARGLPVGLQLVGRRHDDATVLQAACAFEAVRPWRHLVPPGPATPS